MKNIFFAAIFLCSQLAQAGDPPVSLKGQSSTTSNLPAWNLEAPFYQSTKTGGINALIETGSRNLLADPGMEATATTTGWVSDGSGISLSKTTTAANVASGKRAMKMDTTGSASSLHSIAISVPEGLKGKNGYAYCTVKGGQRQQVYVSTSATIDTNVLSLGTNFTSNLSSYQVRDVNFVFPSDGSSVYLWLYTGGNTDTTYIDDCYLGDALNISQVSQATFIGSIKWAGTTSCTWLANGSTMTNFAANASCPTPSTTGSVTAPGTKIPGFVLPSAGPGTYLVLARGMFYGSAGTEARFRVSDGTNSSGPVTMYGNGSVIVSGGNVTGEIALTTATSNWTVQLQGANTTGGASNAVIDNSATSSSQSLEISVYRFPSASQQAITLNQTPWYIDANIVGANISLSASSQASYVAPDDASLTLTQNAGSANVQIGCSGTNAASGTTCGVGNEQPAIAFTNPYAGTFEVCAAFSHDMADAGAAANTSVNAAWQLIETADASQTIVQEGKSRVGSLFITNSGGGGEVLQVSYPTQVCGIFTFSNIAKRVIRLMYEQSVSGTIATNAILADGNTGIGQRDVHMWAFPISQNMPMPLLVGSVSSNSTGLERVERLVFGGAGSTGCTSASCTIVSQSGSWVGSVSRSATGAYQVSIAAGIFSAMPTCVCTPGNITTGPATCMQNMFTSTSTALNLTNKTNAGAGIDDAFTVICMGPR